MAPRVSPERVRDVRFAEQWRGYRTDEVDEFVEQVAETFDQLEGRLDQATQRTALAERRLDERGPDDDLRRTLILAQRTADAALEEAQAEAARMVAEAEERARSILDDLEERKAKIESEVEARIQVELAEVSERRAALEADVELLASYVEHQRSRLVEELRTHLGWLERGGHLEPLAAPTAQVVSEDDRGEVASAEPVPTALAADEHLGATMDDDAASDDGNPDEVSDDQAADDSPHDDDTVLDDLDVIPWGDASGGEDTVAGGSTTPQGDETDDDDPFIAELRRAVDDPEPLGPRDEPGEWVDDVDIYDRHRADPMRSRRRRRP